MANAGGWRLGKKIAPPRFLLFMALFVIGLAALIPSMGWARGVMAAFDIAALVFLLAISTLLRRDKVAEMRQAAEANDANRTVLLGITGVTMMVILVAVEGELNGKSNTLVVALVIVTLALAWLFSNVVYALHYAHMFYTRDPASGGDTGGIDFPGTDEPDYWDFAYFSFTLGMTFQTSDTDIKSGKVRRISIGHCLAAFVFNLGVLAFTINVLGGG